MSRLQVPRLVVAGLGGDRGKTLVSLGIARSLVDFGIEVRAFKKGPDYIDSAWLAAATGSPCRNLDTFLMSDAAILASAATAAEADFILLEGNRGLFDGADAAGSHSTAELAKRLGAPVVLVVDVTKMTRTAAALVLGCQQLDRELFLGGVILNQVATPRQERVIRQAIEEATGLAVLGAVPRLRGGDPLPGRHLGLVTAAEHPDRSAAIGRVARVVSEHVDLDRLVTLAGEAQPLGVANLARTAAPKSVTIGYLHDEVFNFYYPENLEALSHGGARLVSLSPRETGLLSEIDGLYIGGGFPEVHAASLAGNNGFAAALRERVAEGMPVYAECGGLMYLARELVVDGVIYPMAGVLDLVVEQTNRPQGHGYAVARVTAPNPFFAVGSQLCGHEFHYSRVVGGADRESTVLTMERGTGIGGGCDGIVRGRVWASYLHLHALTTSEWAQGLLRTAAQYAAQRSEGVRAWA